MIKRASLAFKSKRNWDKFRIFVQKSMNRKQMTELSRKDFKKFLKIFLFKAQKGDSNELKTISEINQERQKFQMLNEVVPPKPPLQVQKQKKSLLKKLLRLAKEKSSHERVLRVQKKLEPMSFLELDQNYGKIN